MEWGVGWVGSNGRRISAFLFDNLDVNDGNEKGLAKMCFSFPLAIPPPRREPKPPASLPAAVSRAAAASSSSSSARRRRAPPPRSNWPTIPQLYVNGEFIGGCDIMVELNASGELKKLLADAGAVPK